MASEFERRGAGLRGSEAEFSQGRAIAQRQEAPTTFETIAQDVTHASNSPRTMVQRQMQMLADNSVVVGRCGQVQRVANHGGVAQLNQEWTAFQGQVAKGDIVLVFKDKHVKGNNKARKRRGQGFSNQSQEAVLLHAIEAVKSGEAKFIQMTGANFVVEVDSKHGKHGPRKFNIHRGGGSSAKERDIYQSSGDTYGDNEPNGNEYSDSDSDSGSEDD